MILYAVALTPQTSRPPRSDSASRRSTIPCSPSRRPDEPPTLLDHSNLTIDVVMTVEEDVRVKDPEGRISAMPSRAAGRRVHGADVHRPPGQRPHRPVRPDLKGFQSTDAGSEWRRTSPARRESRSPPSCRLAAGDRNRWCLATSPASPPIAAPERHQGATRLQGIVRQHPLADVPVPRTDAR